MNMQIRNDIPDLVDNSYRLTEFEKKDFLYRISALSGKPYSDLDFKYFADFVNSITEFDGFLLNIRAFEANSNPYGFLLIENLPVDELVGMKKSGSISELTLLMAAFALGRPFNFERRRSKCLIDNLMPLKTDASAQLGTNSTDLFWHTEDAHLVYNADYLILFCLRGDPEARTVISCIDEKDISTPICALLEQPLYKIFPDASVVNSGSADFIPLLDKSYSPSVLRFDPLYTSCLNEASFEALQYLINQLSAAAIGVALKPGDMLIIDNRRCVHARTSFNPKYDGQDRWVQRLLSFKKEVPPEMINDEFPFLLNC